MGHRQLEEVGFAHTDCVLVDIRSPCLGGCALGYQ